MNIYNNKYQKTTIEVSDCSGKSSAAFSIALENVYMLDHVGSSKQKMRLVCFCTCGDDSIGGGGGGDGGIYSNHRYATLYQCLQRYW